MGEGRARGVQGGQREGLEVGPVRPDAAPRGTAERARQLAGGWGPPVSVSGKRKMEEMGKLFWPLLENAQFGHLNGRIWKSDN